MGADPVSFPTPHAIRVHRYQVGALDAHNNPVESWVPDVALTAVQGVAPGAQNDESVQPGRDVSEVAWTVYAPAGTLVGARDRVEWLGDVYAVDGEPRDYTRGPWRNFGEGVVIELRRTEG